MERSPSPPEVLATAIECLRKAPENPEGLTLIRASENEAAFLIDNVPVVCRSTESTLIVDLWPFTAQEPEMAMLAAEATWQQGRMPEYRGVADAAVLDRVLNMVDTELRIYQQFAYMRQSSQPASRIDDPADEDLLTQMLIRLTYRWAHQVKTHSAFRGHTADLPGLVVLSSASDAYWNRLGGVWHGYLWSLEVTNGCLCLSISDGRGDCLWIAAMPDFTSEGKPEDWITHIPRLVERLEPAPNLYRFSTREDGTTATLVRVFAYSQEEAYQGLVATTGLPASQVAACYDPEPLRGDTRIYPPEPIQEILARPAESPIALKWTDDSI